MSEKILEKIAIKSQNVRKDVYLELKDHRSRLIDKRYAAGQSAFTAMSEIAMMTDNDVLEELNYGRTQTQ